MDEGVAVPVDGAVDAALPVLQAFLDGWFEEARASFDERMLEACSLVLLADVREKSPPPRTRSPVATR